MKKIINGKKYDTDTAIALGYGTSGGTPRDLSWWKETLYQKRTGEFFLHGEGGPMTRYAESSGQNTWGCGERIMPLNVETAREWAEAHLDPETYEDIFGTVDDDHTKRIVTYSLPVSTIEKLKRAAAAEGISLSEAVARAIEKLY